MPDQSPDPSRHRMIWLYPVSLLKTLNATPTLEITRGLRQIGWEVDLLISGYDGRGEIQGVEIIGIPRPDTYLIGHFFYHIRAMKYVLDRWNRTSIVFFRSFSIPWILVLRLAGLLKRGKRPLFVMDIRTVPMWSKPTIKERISLQYDRLMKLISIRIADGQTTITQRMAEVLQIPSKKLWGVWPSGVVIDDFLPALNNRSWPKGDEPIKIVYIGIQSPERNLMSLCYAVERANQEGMYFELSLVGDGPERGNLENFASQTAGKIQVIPSVPHDQIPTILAKMHVGALPFPDEQKFHVSSPIKLFEYMGAGLPILATRIPCHTDIIGDQPCVFWADEPTVEGLAAALRNIWELRSSLSGMGYLATEIAKSYTWAASAQKLASALQYGLEIKQGR